MPVSDVKKTWRDDDEFNKERGSLAALLDPLIKSLVSGAARSGSDLYTAMFFFLRSP